MDFTGRENILVQIEDTLNKSLNLALCQEPTTIYGLGGVGKTQIAIEYAYRHSDEYALVRWINAETPDSLGNDYAALSDFLGLLPLEERDLGLKRRAVKKWLEQTDQKWLLIFDNATKQGTLKEYRPSSGIGDIIITSRSPDWDEIAKTCIKVETWPEQESINYLHKRTGKVDEVNARELANELGNLPLALAQAASYIVKQNKSITGYLGLFKDNKSKLLARGHGSSEYPDTVATTWDLAFDKIETETPESIDLLRLFSFFAPDKIPLPEITTGKEFLPESLQELVENEVDFDDVIAPLTDYSFVERDEEFISIHRLVQHVTRDRLDETEKKKWAEAATEIVNRAFPQDSHDHTTWKICSALLPHGMSVIKWAESLDVAHNALGRLLNQIGNYHLARAELKKAENTLKRAVDIAEKKLEQDDPVLATRLNNLGMVLKDLGDYEGAKANYERALGISEKSLGQDHPQVATLANNLGLVLHDMGDYEGAKANYERALEIDEKVYGPDHPAVATDVNNLGSMLQDMGDFEGAKENIERALAIDEKVFGPDHPKVAIRLNNLGIVLMKLGDFEGAKTNYERALEIHEKVYGPDHPAVATTYNNLGNVLQDMGDYEGAKTNYERALEIFKNKLGPDHPDTKSVRNNLERLKKKMAGK